MRALCRRARIRGGAQSGRRNRRSWRVGALCRRAGKRGRDHSGLRSRRSWRGTAGEQADNTAQPVWSPQVPTHSRSKGKPSMYAIVKTGGKQYKVAEGDLVKVEKIE